MVFTPGFTPGSTPGSTPGFAPDPGSNTISLHRTRLRITLNIFMEIVTLDHTQSHLIAIMADRPLKARVQGWKPSRLAGQDSNR